MVLSLYYTKKEEIVILKLKKISKDSGVSVSRIIMRILAECMKEEKREDKGVSQ